jgi:short-subunit dehydrogenase
MNSQYAFVTGASTGIGRELAIIAAREGFDLLLAADTAGLAEVADLCRGAGAGVETLEVDLATEDGVDQLYAATQGRAVDALFANAGHGLGRAFLEQDFEEVRHVIDTNITGTIYLIQLVARDMVELKRGRILITGSIAGYMPGTYQAVYNGTKAFIDSFSFALRAELKDTGVSVTCLMPGATETAFFARADMLDTKVGQDEKDDPTDVARAGFDAMMRGDGDVVAGWKNKLATVVANVTPAGMLAEQHRKMAEPGSGAEAARERAKGAGGRE